MPRPAARSKGGSPRSGGRGVPLVAKPPVPDREWTASVAVQPANVLQAGPGRELAERIAQWLPSTLSHRARDTLAGCNETEALLRRSRTGGSAVAAPPVAP